jgi:hypothetical protein
MELIGQIEKITNSRVIVLMLGDRRGLETRMAADVLPFCQEHLTRMGHQEKISLYMYSTGGITMAGYALANLDRSIGICLETSKSLIYNGCSFNREKTISIIAAVLAKECLKKGDCC